MNQQSLSVEEICRKLKPLFGDKIDKIYLKYSLSNSFEEKNEIFQTLALLYQRNLKKLLDTSILLEPPKENEISGKYPLGEVVYAGKKLFSFGLNENDWPRHVCITGMSGSGKTNFAFNILENFIKNDKKFLVFDWKKSFRALAHIDPDLFIFTIGNDSVSNLFKTNINIPPKGVSPKEWITVLADLISESFSISFGAHKIILETLDEVFEGWEIYNLPESKRRYPNWMHIKRMLEIKSKEAKGREFQWYESALRVASVLTFGNFGKVINYEGKKNILIEELFDKRTIFELNSLSNIEKKFFCEFVLTYIYKHKKANQTNLNENFNYAILVDEAHNVFLKDKTNFVSESVTDMAYREMREYGTSLICLDQHISKLSDTIKGNSACHIAFQQQLPQDIYDLSSITQLQNNKDFFSKLPVGSAIVKLSDRYTSPFLIETPLIELRKEMIDDSKISLRMECMLQELEIEKNDRDFKDSIIFEREIESGKWNKKNSKIEEENELSSKKIQRETKNSSSNFSDLENVQEVLYVFVKNELEKGHSLISIEKILEKGLSNNYYTQKDIIFAVNKALKEELKKEKIEPLSNFSALHLSELNEEERSFLDFLIDNPEHNLCIVEFYKRIGFSTRKGNLIKNQLLKKGMIKIQEQKSKVGWKKFIRLAQSFLQSNSQNLLNQNISNFN